MDTAALKHSWGLVAKSGDEVPLYFYSHLFLSHPELREMFPISMSAQRDKLVSALGRIVSNVDELDDVTQFIEQLGRDHRRFSVIADHYNAVGASLLATLRHFLGAGWTAELAADWAAAYGLIAKVMVQAAEESSETTPAWWLGDVTSVERRSLDVTVVQVRPQEPLPFVAGQSVAVEVPQRPRLWRYFSPANAPREDGSLELHVQMVAGGQVSGAFARSIAVGDVFKLGAPVGEQLTLNGARPDLLMVAGGTGLAPLRAVLEQLDDEWRSTGSAPRVELFHGVRVPWSLYDHDYLSAFVDRPWFDYSPVVSDDPSYPGARGLVGSVAAGRRAWQGRTAMVCGSPDMVTHTIDQLASGGLPRGDIRAEDFGAEHPSFASAGSGGAS